MYQILSFCFQSIYMYINFCPEKNYYRHNYKCDGYIPEGYLTHIERFILHGSVLVRDFYNPLPLDTSIDDA